MAIPATAIRFCRPCTSVFLFEKKLLSSMREVRFFDAVSKSTALFYAEMEPEDEDTLLGSLCEFFHSIQSSKCVIPASRTSGYSISIWFRKRTGVTGPRKFIAKLKKDNGWWMKDRLEALLLITVLLGRTVSRIHATRCSRISELSSGKNCSQHEFLTTFDRRMKLRSIWRRNLNVRQTLKCSGWPSDRPFTR